MNSSGVLAHLGNSTFPTPFPKSISFLKHQKRLYGTYAIVVLPVFEETRIVKEFWYELLKVL